MASSDVCKGLLCLRTINIIAYGDGNNVTICMPKLQSVIASSVLSSSVQ